MAYVKPEISNYNANPPPDDGSTGSDNEITWAKHKNKLTDPLKAYIDAVNDEVATELGSSLDTTNEGAVVFAGPTIWKEAALADLKWDDTNKRFSIGIEDGDGTLHIHTATAGAVTARPGADDLVVENSADGGISILLPDSSDGNIYFGSPSESRGARLQWQYAGGVFHIGSNKAGSIMTFGSGSDSIGITLDEAQDVLIGLQGGNDGKLHIDQTETSGAKPVLTLDQGDVSEEFIKLIGESAADDSQSLIDAADLTTPGTLTGWIKVYIEDVQATNPITDGFYYVPFYTAPTA
jgi:hypothetical protein